MMSISKQFKEVYDELEQIVSAGDEARGTIYNKPTRVNGRTYYYLTLSFTVHEADRRFTKQFHLGKEGKPKTQERISLAVSTIQVVLYNNPDATNYDIVEALKEVGM